MRIGLLYVDNFQKQQSQKVGSLGLGFIAAYLEQQLPGIEVEIAITPQEILRFNPDLVGVSAYTETLLVARAHAAHIRKNSHVPLVLGGPHIATNPEDLPPEFDFGVVGEGEELLLEMVKLHLSNGLTPKNLRSLQGATWREEGLIKNAGRAPSIQQLDKLAHPDRRQIFASMYRNFADFRPLLHVHTARGCPYRCTFCSAPLVNPSWRFHSPEWIVEELESIARHFPDQYEITFSDDLFTLKKSRLEALAKAIRSAGLHKRFVYYCSSRSNTLTRDMCRLLRDMNITVVAFGLETASDRLVYDLKGVGTTRKDYERVLELCQHYGIYAHGNFIIGSQDETLADLQDTWTFTRDNYDRLASVFFNHMTPFPGTVVWDEGVKAERFVPEKLDYGVLNLLYKPGESVYLNTHYDEAFYAAAYERFKRMEIRLNDRYFTEHNLIMDMLLQERFDLPELLQQQMCQLGWQSCDIISNRETWLPDIEQHSEWRVHASSEVLGGPATPQASEQTPTALEADGLLLYYSLDESLQPERLLQHLPRKPLLCLTYNVGSYVVLSQLLVGDWQEDIYGPLQRRHQRYFTLKSLTRLLQQQGYHLQQHLSLRFKTPLKYEYLPQLLGTDQLPDPDTFAYLTLWLPEAQASLSLEETHR